MLPMGRIDGFAATVGPNYRIEPFFRYLPQRLDLYYLRDASSTQ